MTENRVAVGVFADPRQAEQAFHELRQAGFRDDQLGFIVRDRAVVSGEEAREHAVTEEEMTPATGAVVGGILGSIAGVTAAILIPGLGPAIAGGILTTVGGAALGAATGGLIVMLTHMGVPEEEAQSYNQEFQAGRIIVIVQTDERPWEAFEILKRNYNDSAISAAENVKAYDPEATVKLETPEDE
ncbi:MAG TPA: hypothetical protein VIZ18_15085 [Ktedonobacteraceae bacterium]